MVERLNGFAVYYTTKTSAHTGILSSHLLNKQRLKSNEKYS
jgi:hypothetical protein